MNRQNSMSLVPTPAFGLGWLCNHVRGAVQLPGEAAYESCCAHFAGETRPHAVVLAADWADVEAARHYAEQNGFEIVSDSGDRRTKSPSLFVRKPKYA